MKIKLISPARNPESGECFWDSKTSCQMTGYKANVAPLALPTLAALTPSDMNVVLTDEKIEPIDFDEKLDLVGITAMSANIVRAYEVADEYRNRGVPVVMGGIHVSMLPNEASEHCDSVVVGEAEEIWERVIRDAQKKDLQKLYRAEQFPELTDAPIPRWDLLKNDKYITFTLQTGRGCPYNCDYCSVKSFNGRKYRHKTIQPVVEEIKFIQRINPGKPIFFTDDNLLAVPHYAEELLQAIIPLNIFGFWCQASVNRLKNEKLLDLMHKANCLVVFVGFESLSQKTLESMNKSQINKVEEYRETILDVYSHKFVVFGSFIVGNDDDDETVFEEIKKFLNDSNLLFFMVNILTPMPGTLLYEKLKNEQRLTTMDWNKYIAEFVCFEPKLMQANALQEKRNELLREIYSYEVLYKRLNHLWSKGVFVRKQHTKFISKQRILFTIKGILTSRLSLARLVFLFRCLWVCNNSSLVSVLLALDFHDYAYRIGRRKTS